MQDIYIIYQMSVLSIYEIYVYMYKTPYIYGVYMVHTHTHTPYIYTLSEDRIFF